MVSNGGTRERVQAPTKETGWTQESGPVKGVGIRWDDGKEGVQVFLNGRHLYTKSVPAVGYMLQSWDDLYKVQRGFHAFATAFHNHAEPVEEPTTPVAKARTSPGVRARRTRSSALREVRQVAQKVQQITQTVEQLAETMNTLVHQFVPKQEEQHQS